MSFTVAIVGRPNVGKSTLFNRLIGKRQALVDDLPGVTRDRREGEARLGDLTFTAVDTAGLEEAAPQATSPGGGATGLCCQAPSLSLTERWRVTVKKSRFLPSSPLTTEFQQATSSRRMTS